MPWILSSGCGRVSFVRLPHFISDSTSSYLSTLATQLTHTICTNHRELSVPVLKVCMEILDSRAWTSKTCRYSSVPSVGRVTQPHIIFTLSGAPTYVLGAKYYKGEHIWVGTQKQQQGFHQERTIWLGGFGFRTTFGDAKRTATGSEHSSFVLQIGLPWCESTWHNLVI